MALRNYLVGEVAEDFVDGLLTRREALRRLTLLGLSVSSATALLAACGNGGGAGGEQTPAGAAPRLRPLPRPREEQRRPSRGNQSVLPARPASCRDPGLRRRTLRAPCSSSTRIAG